MLEYFVSFLVCAFSGVLTGVIGIGGGLVIVPAFLFMVPIFNLDFSIHQIIGISATCVLLNSLTTLFYRRKEKFVAIDDVVKISIAIMMGTLLGAIGSSSAPEWSLCLIYIVVALISMSLIKKDISFGDSWSIWVRYLLFAFIGAISAAIGIGGAVMFAVALKCFYHKNAKELLPTITLLVAIHAVFAFVGKLYVGDVILMIIPIAMVSSIVGAKMGVLISKRLSANAIANVMIATLLIGIARVVFQLM